MKAPGSVTYRRVVLTNKRLPGKTVRELGLDHFHGVTVTRVSRGDLIFTALPDLRLQFGDMLQLVGDEGRGRNVARVARLPRLAAEVPPSQVGGLRDGGEPRVADPAPVD